MSFNEFPHRTRGAAHAAMRPGRVQPRASVTRKDFTAPLGLPEHATDNQILSALDNKLAARDARAMAARQVSADDAMYASIFGGHSAPSQVPATAPISDEELYARVMGA